jgi:hypothetical protein
MKALTEAGSPTCLVSWAKAPIRVEVPYCHLLLAGIGVQQGCVPVRVKEVWLQAQRVLVAVHGSFHVSCSFVGDSAVEMHQRVIGAKANSVLVMLHCGLTSASLAQHEAEVQVGVYVGGVLDQDLPIHCLGLVRRVIFQCFSARKKLAQIQADLGRLRQPWVPMVD